MATDFKTIEAEISALVTEKERGDAFEHAVAHLLRHDPDLGLRRVWGWRDWPGRQGAGVTRDLGIDLVAEDALGQLIGVQAKFRRDPDRLIRWEDVATAVGYRQGLFARRLIATNAWDRGPNAREALGGPEVPAVEPLGWVLRDAFLTSDIDWAGALDLGLSGEAAPDRHPRTPRAHQLAAIRDTVTVLAEHPRAQLVMACGSGKTLTTLWITEARTDQRVLVLVPSLLLLRQFRRDWIESAGLPFVDLVVCSDETTVGRDEISVRTADLGVPVTTDPTDIAAFLRGEGRRVIFATYQSSERIAEAQANTAIPSFDLVVADEAHKLAGTHAASDPRASDQKVVLDAGKIRAASRLFATATPRLYGPAAKARIELEGADIAIASMDDEAVFGPVAHHLSFRSAVEQGILVDYELVVVAVTNAEVADLIDRRAIVKAADLTTDAESLAFLVALRRAIAELGLRRSISFHSSIARARAFARWLPLVSDAEPIPATGHVAGTMPTGERNRIVERLRNPDVPTLITNARCLTEGIDVPALDAVAFVDPRGSHVDVVQAVGRAMRTAPGKSRGRVIIPVFLTEADAADPEAAVASSAFRPLLDVLRALRAHDEELSAEATRLRVELGQRPSRLLDSRFLRDHIRVLDAAASVDVTAFEVALYLRAVEVSAIGFDVWLASLRAFAEREGHARVHLEHVEDGLKLGQFVAMSRHFRRQGRLDLGRAIRLASVPGWTWEPVEDDWHTGMEKLRAFATRTGSARVPRSHKEDRFPLGWWVGSRRTAFNDGRLSADRVAVLESLPGWTWDPRGDDWQVGFEALRRHVAHTGSAGVPSQHVEDGYPLSRWVIKRRSYHRNGSLAPDRIAALEALPGWTWDARESKWADGLAALKVFVAREGHARVDYDHDEGGFRLGLWVAGRRADRRRGSLSALRDAALERLPGWVWEAYERDWKMGLELLKSYAAREGHADVPQSHTEDGFKLGSWVSNRRNDFAVGRLSHERVAELEAISGWTWRSAERTWQTGLEKLRAFAEREGHGRVPALHLEDGFRLGQWVQRRRIEHRKGILAAARTADLESVPGWNWGSAGPSRPRRGPG